MNAKQICAQVSGSIGYLADQCVRGVNSLQSSVQEIAQQISSSFDGAALTKGLSDIPVKKAIGVLALAGAATMAFSGNAMAEGYNSNKATWAGAAMSGVFSAGKG
ncbi:MAG TPA: hypothetical protein VIY47_12030, partial [Ignavibacteriaceae bacterium]